MGKGDTAEVVSSPSKGVVVDDNRGVEPVIGSQLAMMVVATYVPLPELPPPKPPPAPPPKPPPKPPPAPPPPAPVFDTARPNVPLALTDEESTHT